MYNCFSPRESYLSDIITIRVSKELKEEMKKVNINWSQYLRDKIIERLRRERLKKSLLCEGKLW